MKVFVNSLPKSGTHLLGKYCSLIGLEFQSFHLSGSLLRKSKFNMIRNFKLSQRFDSRGVEVDLDIPKNKIKKEWLINKINSLPDNSYFLGHAPYSSELVDLLASIDVKMLYISREPKDVMVSLCNHFIKFENYPFHKEFKELKTVQERVMLSLNGIEKGSARLAPFKERLVRSKGWETSQKVCPVLFGQLIGEKGGGSTETQFHTINSMNSFLGIDRDVDAIIENIFDTSSRTFNKGTVAQWKSVFDDELLKVYNEYVS